MRAPLPCVLMLALALAGTSAAAAEHSAPTLDSLADGALLLDGLGTHERQVTTASPQAQAFFNQGLRLAYGFNHDEAARSFARATQLDPTCAMCFWGVALVLGPNYNMPMLAENAPAAWDALQRARRLAPRTTPVEQSLIAALVQRYPGPEALPPEKMTPFNDAYASAMAGVAARHPEDLDVQTLHAEALMDRNPWKLWSLDGAPAPGTEQIVATLESVLARDPNHLGANHYYIHAVEASPHPEKAEPSADRLGTLAPRAGHIVHMPAHIYQRVGRYADASESNRKAAAADLAYQKEAKPLGHVYPMYTSHNFGFLAYSASMEGRKQETLEAARASAQHFPPELLTMMPGMDFFVAQPLFAMVRFGDWERLLAEPRPNPKYPVQTGLWLHAHGMALAATGQLPQARAELAELRQLARTVPPTMAANLNTAKDVLGVAVRVLEARVAQAEGRPQALTLWRQAVDAADRLSYAEPADWFYPVRHYQGAALLEAGRSQEAEAVYREDLRRNPKNGWGLFGLTQSLEAQGRQEEAARTRAAFETAWARADFPLTTTAP
ncbi:MULTISPECIES: hypothetical protein [Myxococcus]|uniref:hypothetical protein n=1 Tax=Myxococcus TaxID=32 RepID=UPI001162EB6A|nr:MULTISPECIES: hypothetical protein [Myxococcus]QDE81974.1 hypothetical protein BHS07_10700 [Myxococcus xanthus]QDE96282.1 hypothetical protein BHS05_10750 [Myxococcus xanthus]WAM28706.1 hypothetical protein OZ403_11570 [Myxococcus sp. NMCA1]